jgi:hypothetical protein
VIHRLFGSVDWHRQAFAAALCTVLSCGVFEGKIEREEDEGGGDAGRPRGGQSGSGAGGKGGMQGGAGVGAAGRGPGGAGGSGGSSPENCQGLELSAPGVLDLELSAVTVSGSITLEGAPLPAETASRGALVFSGDRGRTLATVELGMTGAVTYALRLPPGKYDVSYAANAELCEPSTLSKMPCGSGPVLADVALVADGVLDVDIPVVSVSGAVTLDGAAFPEVASRGSIAFADAAGSAAGVIPLSVVGAATYSVNLLPGAYDVVYQGVASECAGAEPPAVPCSSGALRERLDLLASGVLDLDVPAVRIAGAVTVNGVAPAATSVSRGSLAFVSESGSSTSARSFDGSSPMLYEVLLLPGAYDVVFVPSEELCARPEMPDLPCSGGAVFTNQPLRADGVLDVDLSAVTVSGSVTLNGRPLPTASADRGAIAFTNTVGGVATTRGLGTSDSGAYSIRLLAGTYSVDYVPNAALCAIDAGPGIPCTGGSIALAASLTAGGVFDVDLRSVRVTGAVGVDGAPMPAASGDRGALSFSLDGGTGIETPSFTPSGAVAYSLSLWPGTYRIGFAANSALCAPGRPAPIVPCVGGDLLRAAVIDADGVLDLNISSVVVSGSVLLNGGALPAATQNRGEISFTRASEQGAGTVSLALGTDAAPSYQVTLSAGRYVVSHEANAGLCPGPPPAPEIPCAAQALFGCQ